VDLSFYPLRFCFHAQGPIYFPPGKAANVLRGGFGLTLKQQASQEIYTRIFEPQAEPRSAAGPSGFKDPPRPFVFRAAHLDGRRFEPGESFYFNVNLFDTHPESVLAVRRAFEQLGAAGLGPGRGKAQLHDLGQPTLVTIALTPEGPAVSAIRIQFVTPIELKSHGEVNQELDFRLLFSRIRDRVSSLRALYGSGPLAIDFKEIAIRAGQVRRTGGELLHARPERRSSRTGQVHQIGGITGWVSYAGELREFLPYLRATEACGVGRHCVWGKGQIQTISQEV
jgi:hypothetical protein